MEIGLIYCIKNKINGKRYIGQTTDYRQRKTNHRYHLKAGSHVNKELQKDYNKYGKNSFKFEIIDDDIPHEDLEDWEMYYIEEIYGTFSNKGYNKVLSHNCISGELNPNYGNTLS